MCLATSEPSRLSPRETQLRSGCLEDALSEVEQRFFPVLEVVTMVIDMPDVGHTFLFQIGMNALADLDQSIFIAGGKPKQFQLFGGGFWVRHKLRRRLCIW